ncbi:hypothetical protein ABIC94_004932 [Variovorax paradoxus]|uniref:hypothetical protein n=1 Tax=Variovorax paradoxus TaxID=34073 RepID=UPI003398280F
MPILNPTRPALPQPPLLRAIVAAIAIATASLVLLGGCPQKEAPVSTADALASDAPVSEAAVAVATAVAVAPASPTPRPTASATLKRAELMALVFPDSQGPNAAPQQPDIVLLPERSNGGKTVPGSEAEHKAQVSPREVVRLDSTHAVMLTETVPLDDQGRPMTGHVNGAWLGAYFFEQGADGWKLASRTDAVDYLGFMGNLGTTKVERIAPQRFALTITHGSCWQGYCGQWLSVYGLETGKVRALVTGIPLSATNEGTSESCQKGLEPAKPDELPRGACFDVDGTPSFALGTDDEPGEMRIAFKGQRTAGTRNHRVIDLDGTLVYAWRKGAYVRTEGRNPVPSF